MVMHSTKKVIRATAKRFQEAVEAAGESLEELKSYGFQDVFEDLAEELVDEAEDLDQGSARQAWFEHVAAFLLLQSMKIDLAEEDEMEEDEERSGS
jgi:formate dehydrogenase maturation protein FdhE